MEQAYPPPGSARSRTARHRRKAHHDGSSSGRLLESRHGRDTWLRIDGLPGIEALVITLALLMASGTFLQPLYASEVGRIGLRVVWVLIYSASFLLLIRRQGATWLAWLVRHQPLIVFVIVLAFASALWSYDPAATGRAALQLLGATVVGVLIGLGFRPPEMMRTLFWIFIALVLLNALSAIVSPEMTDVASERTGASTTAWQGLVSNKNRLGSLATIALILFLAGTIGDRIERVWGAALVLFSAYVVLLSQAATSYVAAATGVGTLVVFALVKRFRIPLPIAALVLILGIATSAYLSIAYIDVFTDMLGRDVTLTRRTLVWQDALAIIGQRPWLGHGLGVVWELGDHTWLPKFTTTTWAAHAHNGYLDVATELGIVGATAAGAQIFVVLFQCITLLRRHVSAFTLFGTAYALAFAVFNLGEACLFQAFQPEWMVFVAISVAIARTVTPRRSERAASSGRRARRGGASAARPKVAPSKGARN